MTPINNLFVKKSVILLTARETTYNAFEYTPIKEVGYKKSTKL